MCGKGAACVVGLAQDYLCSWILGPLAGGKPLPLALQGITGTGKIWCKAPTEIL